MNGSATGGGLLEVKSGSLAGMAFPLSKAEVIIGRAEGSDIVIGDAMVSARHARITIRPGAVLLEDLGSSNGTIINGIKVQGHVLEEGDRIFFGSTELVFHAGAAEGSRRLPLIIGCACGAAVILILIVVLLASGSGDATAPRVTLAEPEDGQRYELPLFEGGTVPVEIEVDASDDKAISKVEVYVDGKVAETFDGEDDSPYRYTYMAGSPGSLQVYAVAYDAAGNRAESESVSVAAWLDQGKRTTVETYEQQVSGCAAELNQYRTAMSGLMARGAGLAPADPAWLGVYEGFESINGSLATLQAKVGGFMPSDELKPAQAELLEAVSALVNASSNGMTWARDSGLGLPTADGFKSQYNQYRSLCDTHRAAFNSLYGQAITGLLGRPPAALL